MQKKVIFSMDSNLYPFGEIGSYPASPPTTHKNQVYKFETKTLVAKKYKIDSSEARKQFILKVQLLKKVQLDSIVNIQSVLELQQQNQIHVLFQYIPISFKNYINQSGEQFGQKQILSKINTISAQISKNNLTGNIWNFSNIGLTSKHHLKYFIDLDKLQIAQGLSHQALYKVHSEKIEVMLDSQFHKLRNISNCGKSLSILNVPFKEFRKSYSIPSNSSRNISKVQTPEKVKKQDNEIYSEKQMMTENKQKSLKTTGDGQLTKQKNRTGKKNQKIIKGNWQGKNKLFQIINQNKTTSSFQLSNAKSMADLPNKTEQSFQKSLELSYKIMQNFNNKPDNQDAGQQIIWEQQTQNNEAKGIIKANQENSQQITIDMIKNKARQAIRRSRKAMKHFRQVHPKINV